MPVRFTTRHHRSLDAEGHFGKHYRGQLSQFSCEYSQQPRINRAFVWLGMTDYGRRAGDDQASLLLISSLADPAEALLAAR